jgi:hypothetical protein
MFQRLIPVVCMAIVSFEAAEAQLCALEEAELSATDVTPAGWFGLAVALSGDTAVVGAPAQSHSAKFSAGAVYVYERGSAATWDQTAKLIASDPATSGFFGVSVALEGDTIVVGSVGAELLGSAPGAAYVFVRNGTTWTQQAKITASDGQYGDDFGASVSLDGERLAVGARSDWHAAPRAGSAYVFERVGTTWGEEAKLVAADAAQDDEFGVSLDLDGDTVVVGALYDDNFGGVDAGSAYVFVRGASSWSEQAHLMASGGGPQEFFGIVALSGDTVVVGANRANHSGLFSPGAAYVFDRSGTAWSEQAMLVAGDADNDDRFGATSIEGDLIVVGAFKDTHSGGLGAGSAYAYQRVGSAWSQTLKLTAESPLPGDWFGGNTALDGGRLLVGAINGDRAHVFSVGSAAQTFCTAGVSGSGCTATLSAAGVASATAPAGFVLTAQTVEGDKDGLFFFGSNGRQANSWGNGTSFQCVVPPVSRAGLRAGTGTLGFCDGSFSQDLNALWTAKPAKNPGAGATLQAQLWYRDPFSSSNQTTSFSEAIEFCVGL